MPVSFETGALKIHNLQTGATAVSLHTSIFSPAPLSLFTKRGVSGDPFQERGQVLGYQVSGYR